MKPFILSALVAAACSSASASALTVAPATANSLAATTMPTPVAVAPVTIKPKAADLQANVSSVPSFCGQALVAQMLMNTDVGKRLQLQQEEAIRRAITQAVAEGRIPARQMQVTATMNYKPAQGVAAPTVAAPTVAADVNAPPK